MRFSLLEAIFAGTPKKTYPSHTPIRYGSSYPALQQAQQKVACPETSWTFLLQNPAFRLYPNTMLGFWDKQVSWPLQAHNKESTCG